MRLFSTAQELRLRALGAEVYLRVRIQDATGEWRDWGDLMGVGGMVVSAEWGDSLDSQYADARVVVFYRRWLANASPLVTGNRLSGYLDIGRRIDIAVALVPSGVTPAASDYEISFDGIIQSYSLRDDGSAELDCRDRIGALLADRWIEQDTTYGDGATTTITSVIEDILQDWGDALTLWTPGSAPSFVVNAYNQQPMSVIEAVRQLALLVGWDIRPRYNAASTRYELALTEPERSSPTSDYTIDGWIQTTRAEISQDDIRNVIQVNYPGGTNAAGERTWSTVWAADGYSAGAAPWVGQSPVTGSSIDRYGRRWMEVSSGTSAGIDNSTEAQALADAILADLSMPDLDWGAELPTLFWPVELNDFLTFRADGVILGADTSLAVLSYRHRIGAGAAYTAVECTGRPKAGRGVWLEREARPGTTRTLKRSTPAGLTVSGTSRAAAAVLRATHPTDGQWSAVQWHRSETAGFTPSPSTLVGHTRGLELVDPGIDPAVEYRYRAVVTDVDGNAGAPSDEVVVRASEIPSAYIERGARDGATAVLSGSQAINSSSYTAVEFDTVSVGQAHSGSIGGWKGSEHVFVAEDARAYRVEAVIRLTGDGSSSTAQARLYQVSGDLELAESFAVPNAAAEGSVIRLSAEVNLTAGQEIRVDIRGSGATPTLVVDSSNSRVAVWPLLHT